MPKERESNDASTNKTQIKKDGDLQVIERKTLINLLGHFTKFLPMKNLRSPITHLIPQKQLWTCTFSIFKKEIGSPLFPSPTLVALLQQDWLQLNPH